MNNSRIVAFDILYKIFSNGAYSNIAIDNFLTDCNDKAFVSNIVYGVVERKITLDYIIDKYLTSKPKPKVKIILYIGAYQLYFMDKVPPSAAINESVNIAKQVGVAYYKNLINAVLHKIDNNRIDVDSIEDLSIKYSCPQSLINMWQKAYGAENTQKILSTINGKPPTFATPNTLYVDADECLYELNCDGVEGEIADNNIMLNSPFDLSKCKSFKNGLFHIQDLSSYNAATALGAKPGDIVIDVCSAPGGKAFTIAEDMLNKGTVYALDLYEHRVNLIAQGADRLGINIIKPLVNDASVFNNNLPLADKVLCDVPCSGFGIIRRKPEIRYKDLDSIKDLPQIQYNILSTSSNYVKTGGKIMYSTCTLNKKENEKVVAKFLDSNNKFVLIKELTTIPTADGGDGFYYALMEKKID